MDNKITLHRQQNSKCGYHTSIHQFDNEQLKAIVLGQSFWSSFQWFSCLENMPENNMLYFYVKDQDNKLIGFMPSQIIENEQSIIFYNFPAWLTSRGIFWKTEYLSENEKNNLSKLQQNLDNDLAKLYPSLIVGHSNSYSSICIDKSLTLAKQYKVLEELITILENTASLLNCKNISIPYLYRDNADYIVNYLKSSGYYNATIISDAVISILWKNFEEYLYIFSSKRRAAIRRERKIFFDAGFNISVKLGSKALLDNFAPLQACLRKKYKIDADLALICKSYSIFRENLNNEILVFSVDKHGINVGFTLFFKHNNQLYNRVLGFDYSLLSDDFCYFNLIYYEPIMWAIKNNISHIHYGPSSYETKLKRGSLLVNAHSFVKFLDNQPIIKTAKQIWQILDKSQTEYRNTLNLISDKVMAVT